MSSTKLSISLSALPLLITTSLYGNIMWPTLLAAKALYSTWFLIVASILIEAYLFYIFLKTISFAKALFLSLIGNIASFLVGTVLITEGVMIATFAIKGWKTIFEVLFGSTSNIYYVSATWIGMYLASVIIELGAVQLYFKQGIQRIAPPIIVGNLITYCLAALYQYFG